MKKTALILALALALAPLAHAQQTAPATTGETQPTQVAQTTLPVQQVVTSQTPPPAGAAPGVGIALAVAFAALLAAMVAATDTDADPVTTTTHH
jgi:hypothetical protein